MPNKDGIVSIGFDYKKDLEKMIKDFEAEMNAVSSNTQLSKGMKKQFDNILAEMRDFKTSMDKELANLGSGKVSQSSFKSFKQTVENKFKGIREDIDRLDVSMSDLNKKMGILDSGFSLDKFSKEFEDARQRVLSTNEAVDKLIETLNSQGISLMSFDTSSVNEAKKQINEITKLLKSTDEFGSDKGAKYELFNKEQAQSELDALALNLKNVLELIETSRNNLSSFDKGSIGFENTIKEINILELKAADLQDSIQTLLSTPINMGNRDYISLSEIIDITDGDVNDKVSDYSIIITKSLDEIRESAIQTREELLKITDIKKTDVQNLNPTVTLNTTSKELWKALKPELDDLQKTLNKNPVVAPVKLVVAPTAVSSTETGNSDVSKSYSKKYQKILAQTGEDAVVDLEGVYKKTFTSVMDTAVSYAKETIGKIQDVFDKNLIKVKYDISQEELDKIQNFVLSNKDGKKVDISGQITKAKQEVEELNQSIEKTAKLLDETKSKGNVKFDGFDKFTQDVSKSIGKLEELQNILKALQNIEITLAKASGIASITELDNQWANVEKRIINATKLDGSFRKNASVGKIASEYQKYIDMGGTNSIGDIDKIKDNKDTLDTIISKAKEFAKQDLSNDSVKELSIELDGIIGKFDELIATVKTATNALYKIIKQTGVSELDKQWSSITNKFKSITDESGKINLSKQRKDVEELLVMYQRYVNMGGSHTPFDLTDNLETVSKLDKAYKKLNETKPIDNSSTIKSETESFKQVEQSVESLTKAIGDTKVKAINAEATAMEDSAEREILAINAIVDSLDVVVKRLKDIKGIKPKIEIKETTSPVETNISSPIKDTFQGDKIEQATTSAKELDKTLEQAVDVPTDKFDEILSKLDLTESKLGKIAKITKQMHIDENGKPVESYTLKDKYGSTEIYGESSNKATKQLLSANYIEYDSKQAEKEAKELLVVEKEITKEIEKQEKAQASAQKKKWQAFENEQKKYVSDQKKTTDIEKNKSTYQELLDTIKQYSEVSKRIAKNETLDGDLELAQKLENKISELQKNPILSSSQIAKSERDLVNLFNQLDTLEKKTTKKQSDKSSAQSAKEQAEAWEKNVKAIQEYMDANTELNKLKAKDKGTGKHASEIAYQTKEVEKFEKAALEARATLSSMINPHEAPIDDWNKWLEMMRQFDQATEGSARSVAQLEDALRNMTKTQLDSAQSKIDSYIKKLNPYTDATKYTSEFISRVNSAQSEIKKIEVASPEGLARLKEIDLIVDKIISDSKLLENKLIKQESKIADIISKMKIFRDSNTNMSKSQRANLQALIDSAEIMAKTGDVTAEAIEHIKIGFSGIKAEVTATGNTGLKMIDRIVQRTEDMNAKFIAQFFSLQDWLRYCKEGITVVRELDTALTEMRKVSDETVSSLEKFQKASFDLADSIGTTALEVQNSTADFMRLGYTLEEASKLSQDANIYANVGDMNIDEATEHMISSIKAWSSEFNSEVETSSAIIDKYNEVNFLPLCA